MIDDGPTDVSGLCPQGVSRVGPTIPGVAVSPTKRVEFDSELLERLRQRRPEMSDRELLESMARMTLRRENLRRVQERNTLSEDEAIELASKPCMKHAASVEPPVEAPRSRRKHACFGHSKPVRVAALRG